MLPAQYHRRAAIYALCRGFALLLGMLTTSNRAGGVALLGVEGPQPPLAVTIENKVLLYTLWSLLLGMFPVLASRHATRDWRAALRTLAMWPVINVFSWVLGELWLFPFFLPLPLPHP